MSERPGSRTEHVRLHTRQLRQQEVSELTASGFSTKGAGLKRENLESDVKFLRGGVLSDPVWVATEEGIHST